MKKRYVFIDIARAFGIILVLFNHWHIGDTANFYYAIGRMGVPLLLFSSGYILFERRIENANDVLVFYKNHLLKFFICNCIWTILWNLFNMFYFHDIIHVNQLISEILVLRGNDRMWNSWFLKPMVGYYLLFPLIKLFIDKVNRKCLYLMLIIAVIYFYVLPYFGIKYIAGIKLRQAYHYFAPYFILYPVIGFLVRIRITNVVYLVLVLAYYLDAKLVHRAVSYADITIVITSFIIFRLICNINECKFQKVFEAISRRTLPIFYIHMPLRYVFGGFAKYLTIGNPHVSTIVMVVFNILICLLIIRILEIIPCRSVKRYLLFQ